MQNYLNYSKYSKNELRSAVLDAAMSFMKLIRLKGKSYQKSTRPAHTPGLQ